VWRHRRGHPDPALRLADISYRSGRLEYSSQHSREPEWVLAGYLDEAAEIVGRGVPEEVCLVDAPRSADFEHLRWFPLPGEALAELRGECVNAPTTQPLHLRP
jgi:hypothetical protein